MRRAARFVIVCAMFIAPVCAAQDRNTLRGLSTVSVTASVDTTQDATRTCGLSDVDLKTAAEFVLQQSRLKLADVGAQAEFQVRAEVVKHEAVNGMTLGCIVILSVGLVAPMNGVTAWGNKVNVGYLWGGSSGGWTQLATMRKEAADLVTSATTRFVVEWAKQN
jgi:hypothetical protein